MKDGWIYVPTLDISKAVQERLFELGYRWESGKTTVKTYDARYLFARRRGERLVITWENEPDDGPEITLRELWKEQSPSPLEKAIEAFGFHKEKVKNLLDAFRAELSKSR